MTQLAAYSDLDRARNAAIRRDSAVQVDSTIIAPMQLVSVAADALTAVVVDLGGAQVSVACNPNSVWTNVPQAMVLRDPSSGRAVAALFPAAAPTDPVEPPSGGGTTTVRRTATITPVSTGTYAPSYGGWGRFNAYRGTDILYQGGGDIGVGLLRGAAFYGDRVLALGASKIVSASVRLMGTGYNSGSWTAVVQACAEGSQPGGDVTLTGGTVGAAMSGTSTVDVDVTGMVELMRAGSAGGLALVGDVYGASWGTSRGGALALSLTYEVTQ